MLFNVAASAVAFGVLASAQQYNYGAPEVSSAPAEITYTSVDYVTITSCGPEVTNCPGKPTTYYSVSTCSESETVPTAPAGYTQVTTPEYTSSVPVPVYYSTPAVETTPVYTSEVETSTPCPESSAVTTPVYSSAAPPPVYSSAAPPPVYSSAVPPPAVYTPPSNATVPYTVPQVTSYSTQVVTVCPGVNYCYATTSIVPSVTTTPVYSAPTTPVYSAPSTPVYSVPVPQTTPSSGCPGGSYCPPTGSGNSTTPSTPVAPPTYTGAAAGNKVSAAVLAIVAVAGLFIAA